jgi:hypothetical protein
VIAAPLLLLFLFPAIGERVAFHDQGAVWMRQTLDAITADTDARKVIAFLRDAPGGRVYAGLRNAWGGTLNFGIPFNSVKLSDLLMFESFSLVAAPSSSLTLSADLMWDIADDRADQLQLLDVRYEVRPTELAAPDYLQRVLVTPRYTVYRVPLSTTEAFATETTYFSVPTQAALFALNRPWFNGPGAARGSFFAYEYPAARAATLFTHAGCSDGAVSVDRSLSDRIDAVVSCSAPTTLVLKVNYHPGWHVTIDGRETATYMASPSFLGVDLPAGRHEVIAKYEANALKVPLAVAGIVIGVVLFWRRRQIEEWATTFLLLYITT